MAQDQKPVVIKKYANRRLYNTETSAYVTLDDLAEMVRAERDFQVLDAKSGEDLTHSVLTQIILDQESRGENLLPVGFLRQIIRFYGDSMSRLVPTYLDMSISTLTRDQDKFRNQMREAFGPAAALEAMQEQTRQNMVVFENALAMMFAPFSQGMGGGASGANGAGDAKTPGSTTSEADSAAGAKGAAANGQRRPAGRAELARAEKKQASADDQEIVTMREQLKAMQSQLEKLSRGR